MHPALMKVVLFLYRVLAIVGLYGVLIGVCGYAFLLGFYGISTSWVAPVTLSPYDERSLQVVQKLVTSRQTLETLTLDIQKLEASTAEMKRHRDALVILRPQVEAAIARETWHNRTNSRELALLHNAKLSDNADSQNGIRQATDLESSLDKELAAGLITRSDATLQRVQLNEARRAVTDSRISEVLLRDSVLQKSTTSTQLLDALGKRAELTSQIAQLDISIQASEQQLQTEREQVRRLEDAIALASHTPYYLAVSGSVPVNLAFVPYENLNNVSVGAPVYNCYLNIVLCRHVGRVKQLFDTEERVQNPIFRTDMRGVMIQLELDDPSAAMSKTLFLNRRPLLI